jgi:polysaccharide export outer membrane protein
MQGKEVTIQNYTGRIGRSNAICLPVLILALLGLCMGGCATYTRNNEPSPLLHGSLVEPARFSDEQSRALIRQSRELLKLQKQDYLVGPDDVLAISIFEWEMHDETKTLEFRVSESGIITLPALGPVRVAGSTVQRVQQGIEKQLSKRNILQNPRVAVAINEYRSRRIAVIGAVNMPGVYAIHENVSTLMDMLTLAGGPSSEAGEAAYILRRERNESDPLRIAVDLEELLSRGNFDMNAVLQGDDVVYVPKAPLIYVYGKVQQPGGFSLTRSMRVIEAVALAGGFARHADKRNCVLIRRDQSGNENMLQLNIVRIENGKDPNIYLRAGDVLNVPGSVGKSILSELWDVIRGIFTFTYRLDSP